jgi:hypothetical protein
MIESASSTAIGRISIQKVRIQCSGKRDIIVLKMLNKQGCSDLLEP